MEVVQEVTRRWTPLPLEDLPTLATEWRVLDFFADIPERFRGSLLGALYRSKPRAVLANVPDIGPLLLLRMRSAVGLLEGSAAIACQQVRNDNAWILALTPGGSGEFSKADTRVRIGNDGLELKQMPPFRPWSWRWNPTCGAALLTVYVDRTQGEIQQWLRENPHLEASEERKIATGKGILCFSTDPYRALSHQQAAYDHLLLEPLAHGALGELSFDLLDTDYGALCATGHSCQELRDYLDPSIPWDDARYRLRIRLNPAEDPWDTICKAINEYAGFEEDSGLAETLHLTPITQLPRWLMVEIPSQILPFDLTQPEGWNHRIRLESRTINLPG